MSGLLTALTFVGVDSGTYNFLSAKNKVSEFTPVYTPRTAKRERMQENGLHSAYTYLGELNIHQVGVIVGSDAAAAVTELQAMRSAIYGDITAARTAKSLGTLSVQLAGWGTPATADATIDSLEPLIQAHNPRHIPYSITWVVFGTFVKSGTAVIV